MNVLIVNVCHQYDIDTQSLTKSLNIIYHILSLNYVLTQKQNLMINTISRIILYTYLYEEA